MTASSRTEWYTITSNCLCEDYNEETGESKPSLDCFGYCWKEQVEQFSEVTKSMFDYWMNDYMVDNFPTWRGGAKGEITARTAEELLQKITNRINDWRGEYIMDGNELLFTIYHHDAPVGGTMRITKLFTVV